MEQIPMLFYAQINLLAYLLEWVWILLGRPGERRAKKMSLKRAAGEMGRMRVKVEKMD